MLNHISIILVDVTHAGNIGSAARAMKTMGLSRLVLVQPEADILSPQATALAAGADDILSGARIVNSLDSALHDQHFIIGTSARERYIPVSVLSPRDCAQKIITADKTVNTAIMFGRERNGLNNEELSRCHVHIHIPTHPHFSSLNLAAAVQIICYELHLAALNFNEPSLNLPYDTLATDSEIQLFYQHLETTLTHTNFLKPHSPRKLMPRLKRLFNRIRIEKMEYDLLMGILKSIYKSVS